MGIWYFIFFSFYISLWAIDDNLEWPRSTKRTLAWWIYEFFFWLEFCTRIWRERNKKKTDERMKIETNESNEMNWWAERINGFFFMRNATTGAGYSHYTLMANHVVWHKAKRQKKALTPSRTPPTGWDRSTSSTMRRFCQFGAKQPRIQPIVVRLLGASWWKLRNKNYDSFFKFFVSFITKQSNAIHLNTTIILWMLLNVTVKLYVQF